MQTRRASWCRRRNKERLFGAGTVNALIVCSQPTKKCKQGTPKVQLQLLAASRIRAHACIHPALCVTAMQHRLPAAPLYLPEQARGRNGPVLPFSILSTPVAERPVTGRPGDLVRRSCFFT